MEFFAEVLAPEACAAEILDISGTKFEPAAAADASEPLASLRYYF